jgi:cytochrome P450
VFLDLIGMSQDRLDEFLQFKNDVIRPAADDPDERLRISTAAGERMYGFLAQEFDRRLQSGKRTDDLIDRLMHAEIEGAPLTRENLFDVCYLLMFAGLDTVALSLSCLLAWLAKHPDARRSLVAEPELISAAIEELMRVEAPVQGTHRYATADFELAGVPVYQGDKIHVMWAGANLDGSAFENPLEVDFWRPSNRHIAFASGFHRCLGSHLARQELRCALEEFSQPDSGLLHCAGRRGRVLLRRRPHRRPPPCGLLSHTVRRVPDAELIGPDPDEAWKPRRSCRFSPRTSPVINEGPGLRNQDPGSSPCQASRNRQTVTEQRLLPLPSARSSTRTVMFSSVRRSTSLLVTSGAPTPREMMEVP